MWALSHLVKSSHSFVLECLLPVFLLSNTWKSILLNLSRTIYFYFSGSSFTLFHWQIYIHIHIFVMCFSLSNPEASWDFPTKPLCWNKFPQASSGLMSDISFENMLKYPQNQRQQKPLYIEASLSQPGALERTSNPILKGCIGWEFCELKFNTYREHWVKPLIAWCSF